MKVPILVLKNRADFLRLRKGRRFTGRNFLVQGAAQSERGMAARVGFTVTTKVGNAVVRNRIKRRLRNVVRKVFPTKSRPGFDYVLIARRAALRSDFNIMHNFLLEKMKHFRFSLEMVNGVWYVVSIILILMRIWNAMDSTLTS